MIFLCAVVISVTAQNIVINGENYICSGSSTTLSVGTSSPSSGTPTCTSSVNISNTTTTVSNGQTICFYDSGGPNGSYSNSESYVHTFTANGGGHVTITFLTATGETCCDYITIYDGASTSSTQLHYGLLSTVDGNVSFTSTGTSLTVQFTSDGSVTYDGWHAIVSCAANTAGSVNMSNTTTVVTCGQGISFYDSGGPSGTYSNSESYVHTFTSSNGNPLTITFLSTDGESCCDYITIYNGAGTSGTQLHYGLLSSVAGASFTSTGNSITVQFTSDGSVTYNGWYAIVSCDACSLANTTYHWSTGATTSSITVSPTTTTTYSVTTTSPDCGTQVASVTVNVQDCGADGCPSIAPAQQGTGLTEIVVDCNTQTITLEANAVATALQTNSYTVTAIPYNPPYGFTAGTRIFTNAQDDTWGEVLNLPFGFCFYGNTFNQIVPGANSVATFNTDVVDDYCDWSYSESLPSSSLFTNTIFACYRDIYPNYYTGDGIYQGVLGSYPCRSYVLSFNNIALFSCYEVQTFSSQIVLYEGTNIIDIYLRDAPTCTSWNSGNGVIGIQNSTGSAATVPPGRNTGAWTAHNEAWRFIPNGGDPVYTVTWYEGQGTNGPVVGTGDVITVTPPGTTYYTARLQYHACNGDQFDILNYCHVTMNNSADPITVNAEPDFLCANQPTTISVTAPGATGYLWNTGATAASFIARPNQNPTTYTVTVTYGNGCRSVGSVTVNLDQEPPSYNGNVGPIEANFSDCIFTVPDLTSLVRPYVTDNYTSNPNITITQSPAAGTVITGNTTVTITFTDECGNSSTTTIVVNANNIEILPIEVTAEPDFLCANHPTTLTATAPDATEYHWSTGGTTASIVAYPSQSPTTYSVTVGYGNGCVSYGDVTVTLDLEPPTYNGNVGAQEALNNNCVFTIPDVTSLFQPYVTDNYSSNANITITQSPTAGSVITTTTTVTITFTDECGNSSTTTIVVNADNPMNISVAETTHVLCYGDTTGSAGVTVGGGVTPYTYSWSSNNGFPTSSFNGASASPLMAGTYTVTATDANGCHITQTITINNLTDPMVAGTVSSAQDICRGTAPSPFTVTGCTGGDQGHYQWQQSTDNQNFSDISGATSTTYTAGTLTNNMCYRVAYISDACGTVYTAPVCVTLHDATSSDLYDEVCQGRAYNANGFSFSASQTQTPGELTDVLHLQNIWGCDSAVTLHLTVLPNSTGTDAQTIVENNLPYTWNGVTFTEAGTQTTTLTAANGCDSVLTMTLTVIPNIHTAQDTTICENELPITWQGHTFNAAGSFDIVLPAAGGSDSIITLTVNVIPAQFVTVNGEICQHEPYSGYGFTVSADSTNEVGVVQRVRQLQTAQGCDSTVTLLLTVHPVYNQTFDVVACDSMVWNGQVYHQSGTYTQQFSSAHSCDSVVTKNVEVVNTDLVLTNLTEDFCEDLTAVLEVTTELQFIHWNTGETTPQIEVHRAGTYVVTAHTAQCEAFARVDIHPCPFYMYLPNAITPSISGGVNDEFHVPDGIAEQLETCEVWIYDRWGMLVYHSTDRHFRWDGTVNGKIATNNVFSYRLKVSVFGGGNYQYSGTITVL